MAIRLDLKGTIIKKGQRWVTTNWKDMVVAHAPELDEYVAGTLNVELIEEWQVPGDQQHCEEAHRLAVHKRESGQPSFDFEVVGGNYIHPTIRVVQINDTAIDGRLYFPGGYKYKYQSRRGIEILSKTKLREALALGEEEERDVTVVVLIEE